MMAKTRKNIKDKMDIRNVLILCIFGPFLIRFYFYNFISDHPIGWLIMGLIIIGFYLKFGRMTRNRSHEVKFYGNKFHLRTKAMYAVMIPLILASLTDDWKLTQEAAIKNQMNRMHYNFLEDEDKQTLRDKIDTLDVWFNAFSLPTRLVGGAINFFLSPILEVIGNNRILGGYKSCVNKKMDGEMSSYIKKNAYSKYTAEYMESSNANFNAKSFKEFDNNLWTIGVNSSVFRVKKTMKELFKKVFLFQDIGSCV